MDKPFSFGIKLKKIESKFSTSGTYLECVKDNHNKFYYLYIRDTPTNVKDSINYPFTVIFHFGKIGSDGATVTHKFKEFEDAKRFLAKKVKQKLEKEYVRVDVPSNPTVY